MTSPASRVTQLPAVSDFGLIEHTSASGLCIQVLPSGALFALRHGDTLLNQALPGPAEEGIFRLLLRLRGPDGATLAWAPLAGPNAEFRPGSAPAWRTHLAAGLTAITTLTLHPHRPAWCWRVELRNVAATTLHCDILLAHDLGLADLAAVRNNEAYISQYIDLLPLSDPALGAVVLARQNQPMAGGRHPWAAFACAEGAVAFCTDGAQFFGADYRLTQEPAAVRAHGLPSQRSQQECALAGLQSRPLSVAPASVQVVNFVATFDPHHPAASGPGDLATLQALLPANWAAPSPDEGFIGSTRPASPFLAAPMLAGDDLTDEAAAHRFPESWRHVEKDSSGRLLSFFTGRDTHVVTRAKESGILRPHGHVMRSGNFEWIDDSHFGITCFAAGIFGAQAYLGNPSLARLTSVVRNHLGLLRASGQRLFVRRAGVWRQLGVPTLFTMRPGAVSWIYEWADLALEVDAACAGEVAASVLRVRVRRGGPCEFLVTHQLALGANEFDSKGQREIHGGEGRMSFAFNPASFAGSRLTRTCFGIAIDTLGSLAELGGLEVAGEGLAGPYACVRTSPVRDFSLFLFGSENGPEALPEVLAACRSSLREPSAWAVPPAAPMSLAAAAEPAVARVNEILPWFTHNAAIHFSAPHGLEQYGGAAWGVRDVCQGSVEWLLAAGRGDIVRSLLRTVFAQQYASGEPGSTEGGWPQWFMFPPFRSIQQAHSHGDVCFWPVKALCDYVEATNDFTLLGEKVGYTDAHRFEGTGPEETLWQHCDRVLALVEARFVHGTALVNYGDGDWDDTLQPADPALRTRMVSAWTVALAYQTFRQLAGVAHLAGERDRASRLGNLLTRMRTDFAARLMPGGTVAGFLVCESDGSLRPLLHPDDKVTGIRYRLLPMTRSVLAELFSPAEAAHHLAIVERELRYADGVRLMSEPAVYAGGQERLFKRAESAANVGREIGLLYVHAHLRYAEALGKVGDADRLWEALQVVNPVALKELLPHAAARQANVYFSSSDAAFEDRLVAAREWGRLRTGEVAVRAGWRLYSSGPGLYLHKIRSCLVGLRESFDQVVFDPVLPHRLDGLVVEAALLGRPVSLHFHVDERTSGPQRVVVNGTEPADVQRESNPYRLGGLCLLRSTLAAMLRPTGNRIEIHL